MSLLALVPAPRKEGNERGQPCLRSSGDSPIACANRRRSTTRLFEVQPAPGRGGKPKAHWGKRSRRTLPCWICGRRRRVSEHQRSGERKAIAHEAYSSPRNPTAYPGRCSREAVLQKRLAGKDDAPLAAPYRSVPGAQCNSRSSGRNVISNALIPGCCTVVEAGGYSTGSTGRGRTIWPAASGSGSLRQQ